MYGKAFASMFTGSMIGAGSDVFAVWTYVIANMQPDLTMGAQVELNPKLLAHAIGEDRADIEKAIDFLCQPDPESRTPDEEGRRLIRIGVYDYRVVNGPKYMEMRDEEERREKNRVRQANYREKLKSETLKPKTKIKKPKADIPATPISDEAFWAEGSKNPNWGEVPEADGERMLKQPEYRDPEPLGGKPESDAYDS